MPANHQREKYRGHPGPVSDLQECSSSRMQRRNWSCWNQHFLSGTGAEPEPPVHLLGAGAGAVYHNKLCVWLRSLRLCGQPGDDVGKKSRVECDATTRRSAAAPASETNRAPSRTAKLVQRSQSDLGFRFTVLFTGALWRSWHDFRLLCRRLAFDFLALHDLLDWVNWNRGRVSRR